LAGRESIPDRATDCELARIVRYLVEENRLHRARLPERINVTRKERNRLLRVETWAALSDEQI
jgi:hypothetical protein